MATNEELQEKIDILERKILDLENKLSQGNFSSLKVYEQKIQAKNGVVHNYYSDRPTHATIEGDTVMINASSTYAICAYLQGSWRCQDLT